MLLARRVFQNLGRSDVVKITRKNRSVYSLVSKDKKGFVSRKSSELPHTQKSLFSSAISKEFQNNLANYVIGNKKLRECTNQDLANWMERQNEYSQAAIDLVRSTPELSGRFMSEDFDSFLNFLPVLTRKNMHSYFQAAVERMLLPFSQTLPVITNEEICMKIKSSLPYIQDMITKSSDLAWQQKNICSYIANPLPVHVEPPSTEIRWNTFFFDDLLTQDEPFKRLKLAIDDAKSSNSQDMKLIHIVQMSGAGKTHFAISYARKGDAGGIVLRYLDNYHKSLFDAAERTINQARKMLTNSNITEEKKFLEHSKRTMMLISLTALELAEKFYNEAKEKFATKKELHDALVRFLFTWGRDLVTKMFDRNLTYVTNDVEFEKFAKKYANFAKDQQLVIFLDEIHLLAFQMEGEFIHEIPTKDESMPAHQTPAARQVSNDELVSQAPLPSNTVGKRPTSLLYVLVLAMESFLKLHRLTHITTSTSYSAMRFFTEQSSARGRFRIHYFLLYEDAKDRLDRFKELLFKTFGKEKVEPQFLKYLTEFRALASRPVYLWNLFNMVIAKDIDTGSFESFFDMWVERAVNDAESRAEYYFTKAKTEASNNAVVNRVIREIALGANTTELEIEDSEKLIELGLIDIKDMSFPPKEKTVALATDYYLRRTIQQETQHEDLKKLYPDHKL